jgi:hypothetical protein
MLWNAVHCAAAQLIASLLTGMVKLVNEVKNDCC